MQQHQLATPSVARLFFKASAPQSILANIMNSQQMMHRFLIILLWLVVLLWGRTEALSASARDGDSTIRYQPGQKRHEFKIATTLAKELMNPLGINAERFIVATTTTTDKDDGQPLVVGWAQLKPLGNSDAVQDPNQYDAPPGSYDIEQEVDDSMLDEFEDDTSIQVPNGAASFPWTKEYRDMERGVQERKKRRDQLLRQTKKERALQQLYELSSVYVMPEYRSRGIGSELVRRVLRRQLVEQYAPPSQSCRIYCLTLATTAPWYTENFGFEKVEGNDIPASMAMEVMAGNLITNVIGAELCCMRGSNKTIDLLCNKLSQE